MHHVLVVPMRCLTTTSGQPQSRFTAYFFDCPSKKDSVNYVRGISSSNGTQAGGHIFCHGLHSFTTVISCTGFMLDASHKGRTSFDVNDAGREDSVAPRLYARAVQYLLGEKAAQDLVGDDRDGPL